MVKKKTKKKKSVKKPPKKRTILKVRICEKTNKVTHYLLNGNKIGTPIAIVARMAAKGLINNAHSYDDVFVRSDPDNKTGNNLRNLPKF